MCVCVCVCTRTRTNFRVAEVTRTSVKIHKNIFTDGPPPPPNQQFCSWCFIFNRYLKSSAIYLQFQCILLRADDFSFISFFFLSFSLLWLLCCCCFIFYYFSFLSATSQNTYSRCNIPMICALFSAFMHVQKCQTIYFTRTIVKKTA